MSPDQLQRMMPASRATYWHPYIAAAMLEFGIVAPLDQAAFLANIAHESAQMTVLVENLNYSAQGLAKTWKRYRSADGTANGLAMSLTYKPQAIANNVYANRMGNGTEASGDGWRHRGSGLLQVTGKENQIAAAVAFGIQPNIIGEWLRTPEGAARSAARFWKVSGCSRHGAAGEFDACCDLVNLGRVTEAEGDAIGYADRLKFYKLNCAILGAV